jgi:hypothetical protein
VSPDARTDTLKQNEAARADVMNAPAVTSMVVW